MTTEKEQQNKHKEVEESMWLKTKMETKKT